MNLFLSGWSMPAKLLKHTTSFHDSVSKKCTAMFLCLCMQSLFLKCDYHKLETYSVLGITSVMCFYNYFDNTFDSVSSYCTLSPASTIVLPTRIMVPLTDPHSLQLYEKAAGHTLRDSIEPSHEKVKTVLDLCVSGSFRQICILSKISSAGFRTNIFRDTSWGSPEKTSSDSVELFYLK